ncbi:hypothetical protein PAF17_15910 [Paracoccus sp. Z330]|uniref:XRE family transcriptional regulator n=1 Tax=Paracoccus onchidii TaxID=3017813 RepID=A0ABT4ZI45_9RHOB|nr:hypothetical protein [Paracoccus onchidii]MDB6178977.1 hypothetical protein [Paracoccus onchidii]
MIFSNIDQYKQRRAEIESRISEAGITEEHFLKESGINRTTWQRWGHGKFMPRMDKWMGVEAAFSRLIQERKQ